MSYQTIELKQQGPVAILSLNRPDKLNAITKTMLQEIEAALNDVEQNESIYSLVLNDNRHPASQAALLMSPSTPPKARLSQQKRRFQLRKNLRPRLKCRPTTVTKLGSPLTKHIWAFEAGYADLGEVELNLTATSGNLQQLYADVAKIHPLSAKGYLATAQYQIEITDDIKLFGRFGHWFRDSRYITLATAG